MSLACEAEVRVQNESALRFSIVHRPVPLLEYIKSISSSIGASHILAIFEENDSLKVFFDDKKYVDTVIRSGIHVMGHHVRIDYVVPPGVKIILSNVDPVITNVDVLKILSEFGNVVSPCIRPPISDDTELCHIGYGVRYVYMTLTGTVPNRIEFKYGDQIYVVKARIEEKPVPFFAIPYIKTDDSDSNFDETSGYESLPGPSGVEINGEICEPYVLHAEGSSQPQIESTTSLNCPSVKRKVGAPGVKRKVGRPKKDVFVKSKRITPTTQAARRIRKNAKHKFMSVRFSRYKRNVNRGRKPKVSSSTETNLSEKGSFDPISVSSLVAENNLNHSTAAEPFKPVLHMQDLLMYLDEVKHHRAPLELAKKYIGEQCDTSSLHNLIGQLIHYNANHNDLCLKQRVFRLIRSLKDAM